MAIKEFKYKGYTLKELQDMSLEKLEEIVPSSVKRKFKRGMTFDKKVQKAIESNMQGNPPAKPVKTHRRNILVLPSMVGMQFAVYRGNSFETLQIMPEMIGFSIGEFIMTRKAPKHTKLGVGASKSTKHVGKK
jgi:small subunit ribosomal protein S19